MPMKNISTKRDGRNVIVLLTACIDPGATSAVQRRDCSVRMEDYKAALHLWLNDPAAQQITFCENSGYDLSQLAVLNGSLASESSIEFLSFHGNKRPEYGKGYGEMEILEYALANSRFIQSGSWVLKVTGRLYVRNVGAIIQQLQDPREFDVLCDLRGNLSWSDSRVFLATPEFMRTYLLPLKDRLNDSLGVTFEHVLAQATHRALSDNRKWAMIPLAPEIIGTSGTCNVRYPDSILSLLRREFFRRIKASVLSR